MTKRTMLKQIQNRLPDDIRIIDDTSFEFSDDEFISILSWIKYLNWHYRLEGKNGSPAIQSPVISSRIRLDFYFYWFSEKKNSDETGYNIYILPNIKTNHEKNKQYTVKELINIFHL